MKILWVYLLFFLFLREFLSDLFLHLNIIVFLCTLLERIN